MPIEVGTGAETVSTEVLPIGITVADPDPVGA